MNQFYEQTSDSMMLTLVHENPIFYKPEFTTAQVEDPDKEDDDSSSDDDISTSSESSSTSDSEVEDINLVSGFTK